MQEQTVMTKEQTRRAAAEQSAMNKAAAYYEWCVEHGRLTSFSSTDYDEHRHHTWISKYKAAVRGTKLNAACYPSVTRYLKGKLGGGFFGSRYRVAMDKARAYVAWKKTGAAAFNHEDVLVWFSGYKVSGSRYYEDVNKYLMDNVPEDFAIDTRGHSEVAMDNAVELVKWSKSHEGRLPPYCTKVDTEKALLKWFMKYRGAMMGTISSDIKLYQEVTEYLTGNLDPLHFATKSGKAMDKAKKYVKWCIDNGRKPKPSDGDEAKTLYSWCVEYIKTVKGIRKPSSTGQYTEYPEVTKYIIEHLGESWMTKGSRLAHG